MWSDGWHEICSWSHHRVSCGIFKVLYDTVSQSLLAWPQWVYTSGQEWGRQFTRVYYKGAAGCIIMFDLDNRKSFDDVQRWKKDLDDKVRVKGKKIPCLLLGNKVVWSRVVEFINHIHVFLLLFVMSVEWSSKAVCRAGGDQWDESKQWFCQLDSCLCEGKQTCIWVYEVQTSLHPQYPRILKFLFSGG